ncbi:MAG TPA: cell division/cell wall cluster transcriptional repressor MraZ [Peptococcaceae bacterium]|nr:MAG: Protein MraZ [Clostridia bacterium 41_269]HBT20120.1 cell division/cell wall cluster transcriptional repressor MraZ [Peptococcaceae bacterium]
MFMGEYEHTLDTKGRVIIPAKFRDELGDRFVVTKGLDNCLFLYPMNEWEQIEQKLRSLPFNRSDARAFARFFFSGACECEVDKQGRVLLPANLRRYADLDKEVVIIGVLTRVEIWNKENWEKYSRETREEYEEIAEKIVDIEFSL